jgi:hypothetical protein
MVSLHIFVLIAKGNQGDYAHEGLLEENRVDDIRVWGVVAVLLGCFAGYVLPVEMLRASFPFLCAALAVVVVLSLISLPKNGMANVGVAVLVLALGACFLGPLYVSYLIRT